MTKEPFSDEKRSRKTSKPDVEVNPERLKILEKLTINHRNRIVSQYQQIQELKAENEVLRKAIEEIQDYLKLYPGHFWTKDITKISKKALSKNPRKEGE